MSNTQNNQNSGNNSSTAIVSLRSRPIPARRTHGMKALAILAGAALSVATAVRVTTAHEAADFDAPATQPATEPSATRIINASDSDSIVDATSGPQTGPRTMQYAAALPADDQPATPAPAPRPTGPSANIVSDGIDAQGKISVTVNKSVVI